SLPGYFFGVCVSLARCRLYLDPPLKQSLHNILDIHTDRFLEVRVYLCWATCVAVVREVSKEEIVMQETKRMADEANRLGQQAQEWMQGGFEAASRSFTEANKGFQTLAAEMMEYSKAGFDDAIRTWEQLIGVRSLEQAIQIQ